VLQCVAVCCRVLQCVAVCCRVLQCVAVCCSVLQCVVRHIHHTDTFITLCCSVLQCVAVCCSVLQCAAVCCSVQPASLGYPLFRFPSKTLLSLCAVSWMWLRHRSVVILSPEGGLESRCDSQKKNPPTRGTKYPTKRLSIQKALEDELGISV